MENTWVFSLYKIAECEKPTYRWNTLVFSIAKSERSLCIKKIYKKLLKKSRKKSQNTYKTQKQPVMKQVPCKTPVPYIIYVPIGSSEKWSGQ